MKLGFSQLLFQAARRLGMLPRRLTTSTNDTRRTLLLMAALGLAAPALAAYDQSLTRTLDAGKIYGKTDANNTHAFLGIPFAQAPVGNLRWKAPLPPQPWSGSKAATTFKFMCAQIGSFFGEPDPATFDQPVGSEDCLYLNVWRPNSSADNLPVFFYIHGGSNLKGSAREPLYDGAYLAKQGNMVVVTVQYRLGMLGFLNHPALKVGNAKDNSGNFATLDLIRALDWVQANIGAFGGNKYSVTVAGQSAGCINTWGLLQSPLATGKFHRALCTSGIPNALPPVVGTLAAELLIDNILVDNGSASNLAHAALVRAGMSYAQVRSLLQNASAAQIMKFSPAAVPTHFTDGTVVNSGGLPALMSGIYNKMPIMLGSVNNEGTYAAFSLGMGKPTPTQFWHLANYVTPTSVTLNDLIKPEFQLLYPPTHEAISYGFDLVIDNTLRVLRLTSGNGKLFRYNFKWDDTPGAWKTAFAAFHGLDLAFLFGNFVTEPNFMRFSWTSGNASARKAVSDKFIKHVSTFARYGVPSLPYDGQTVWTDWTNYAGMPKRMVIDNTSGMSASEDLLFWSRFHSLTQQQKNFVLQAIDFGSMPDNVDPFRSGTH